MNYLLALLLTLVQSRRKDMWVQEGSKLDGVKGMMPPTWMTWHPVLDYVVPSLWPGKALGIRPSILGC